MILSDIAQKKVIELIAGQKTIMKDYDMFLRVTAMPEENSYINHQTYLDYEKRSNDVVYSFNDFEVRIDSRSVPYLEGASIDYLDTADKKGFFLNNPNSKERDKNTASSSKG